MIDVCPTDVGTKYKLKRNRMLAAARSTALMVVPIVKRVYEVVNDSLNLKLRQGLLFAVKEATFAGGGRKNNTDGVAGAHNLHGPCLLNKIRFYIAH